MACPRLAASAPEKTRQQGADWQSASRLPSANPPHSTSSERAIQCLRGGLPLRHRLRVPGDDLLLEIAFIRQQRGAGCS